MSGNIISVLEDFRLITAEITYHLPDYPALLQTFVWQHYDLPPQYPHLHHFLEFWLHSIEGKLHSVRVAHADAMITEGLHLATLDVTLH